MKLSVRRLEDKIQRVEDSHNPDDIRRILASELDNHYQDVVVPNIQTIVQTSTSQVNVSVC